jgi:MYXO-CTERM domain-containing protein
LPAATPPHALGVLSFADIDTRTCFHHTDRPTGRACTRCGRPACPECLHDAPVGAHCWECIKAARPPTGERLRRWNATAGPIVTKALIGINIVVFLFTGVQGRALLQGRGLTLLGRLSLYGPAVANGEWYRTVTGGFVHYGLIHIAFNMVLLYQFGRILEEALGHARFLALYLAARLAGSFGALLLTPHAFTGGASGAVFGLLGATAIGLRRRRVSVWQSGVGALLVINLLLTFVVPGISIGGHLGGLAGGALVGGVMLRLPPSRRATLEGIALATLVAVASVIGAVAAAQR